MTETGDGLSRTIAYFSMEVGINASMPTYSGGLGVLAGDSLRAAADLGLPMVAVTLLHREGYFRQHLDERGRQTESAATWSPEDTLEPLPERASVQIEGRDVFVRAWRHAIRGIGGGTIAVYSLDTAIPENDERDQSLTGSLYGGDTRYRLCQEVLLGIGGVAMLRALGYSNIGTYHMNEGHSALLTLSLLEEQCRDSARESLTDADLESVRRRCVFTTHTPVSAGHDKFELDLVQSVLGRERAALLTQALAPQAGTLNMTSLALSLSRKTNAVSKRHGKVSQVMFPGQPIGSITNGVHAATWTSPSLAALYDRHVPGWRRDNSLLRGVAEVSVAEIQTAHASAKRELLAGVGPRSGVTLDAANFTICFARRAAAYKRVDLLFADLDRLQSIVDAAGPIQLMYAGKAHPRDTDGKAAIEHIFTLAKALSDDVRVIYLENYDMTQAGLLTAGVDLWLNNPQKPLEASGTSGMKAALNGVPSLSILDGWWLEGWDEGVTGWAIGDDSEQGDPEAELESLYDKLERVILPMFYQRPQAYAEVMRSAIARNGSYFTTQRMMQEYATEMYDLKAGAVAGERTW